MMLKALTIEMNTPMSGTVFAKKAAVQKTVYFGRIPSLTTVRFVLIDTLPAGFIIGFSVSEKWL